MDPLKMAVISVLMVGVMLTPTLGALSARLVERRGFVDAGLRLGDWRFYPVALFLPVLISLASALLSVFLGQARFDPYATAMLEVTQKVQPGKLVPEFFRSSFFLWVLMPLTNLTLGVAITSLFTFGEEFGWRGYLQVRLMRYGELTAMVLTGVTWGLWHAPIILQGHNYPKHPQLGVMLMVVFCVVWAVILGWLRVRSSSVFTCAVAHGSLNSPAAGMMTYFRDYDTAVGMLTGVIGIGVAAGVAFALWRFAKPSHSS